MENDVERQIIQIFYKISHECARIAEEHLKNFKMSFPQIVILHIIYNNGDKALCQKDLVELLGVKGSSVTSIINTMTKSGLIERANCNTDGRKVLINLTEKGREVHCQVEKSLDDIKIGVFDNLTREETEQLLNILLKII
ncbi:MAG: MarR family winged helix-turn-helix transcriptional regulator [Lachnospirales bacterium]